MFGFIDDAKEWASEKFSDVKDKVTDKLDMDGDGKLGLDDAKAGFSMAKEKLGIGGEGPDLKERIMDKKDAAADMIRDKKEAAGDFIADKKAAAGDFIADKKEMAAGKFADVKGKVSDKAHDLKDMGAGLMNKGKAAAGGAISKGKSMAKKVGSFLGF
jgi:hypothetical protein